MTIGAGTRLGPYEIVAPLGAGGMGEVYRARDTRLGRDVAVKVLPRHLSDQPEVRARFEREAKTVSSLNHPHICVLHDVGREGETDFLVMELVEGESLAERLARGALAVPEVLRIGLEIADALDRAHRAGVIHRDLKPGNVMLSKSGAKLMDFGLARATGLAGPAAGSGMTMAALTQSPTVAAPLTAEGSIVGTFQYMSPEQLEGKEADARTDLFAFGAMLYEMATGKKAFEGRSQASLIAAILEREPAPLSSVAPLAPPPLERLVRACLAKDPDQRVQTAHDVKLQLQWIVEGGSQAGVPAPVAARRRGRERLAWTLAAGLGAVLAVAGGMLLLRRPEPPRVTRFEVGMPAGVTNIQWPRLSPDGRMLAMLGTDSTGTTRIWIRPLDAFEAHPLPGTEGTGRPFWSPDSRFLAFISSGKLRKVPVAGGPPVTIADAPGGADGDWGTGDIVVFDGGGSDSIRAVSASGGAVRKVTFMDRSRNENQHAWPHFLPDGKHFLFLANSGAGDEGDIKVGTLGSKETRILGRSGGRIEYSPPGYLLFPREGTLVAQPFDVRSLKTTGDAVPVGERITLGSVSGHFSASHHGVLAYRVEQASASSHLMWVDRAGRELAEASPPGQYRDFALSPDAGRVAFGLVAAEGTSEDIWVRDLARGVSSRLTFGQGQNIWPIWTPDGSRVAYCSNRAGDFKVYTRLASGGGEEDSLAHAPAGQDGPSDWSSDGRFVVLTRYGSSSWDIAILPQDGDHKPLDLIHTQYHERNGRLSPDGRWLAYSSGESGRPEVYVTAFPGAGGKWQISTGGGVEPFWRADGRELLYRAPDGSIMAVPIQAGAEVQAGQPVALFKAVLAAEGFVRNRWMPAADGQRILLNLPLGNATGARFAVVTHWAMELKRK